MTLRILHVIGGLELGGAETLLYRVATRPSPEFEHEVICLGPPDWYSARLEEKGVRVSHLGMTSPLSSLRAARGLARLIRQRQPDLIQSWMYFANVLSSLFSRGTPVVWGIHGSTLEHLGAPSHLFARAGGLGSRRLSDFVINCSERSAQIHAKLGYDRVPNEVIPNGYDPDVFRPNEESRAAIRGALGIQPNEFVVGSISRWHSQKDIPSLLRGLALAAEQGVQMRCLLIGRGLDPDNENLTQAIRRSGCEGIVEPLGSRNDIAEVARVLDLHLLSSSGGEAFPNVVAETMLSGTPNLVTDIGDSRSMVGETGWVIPAQNPERIAEGVCEAYREWSQRNDRWQRRRVEARSRIVERFTFDRMVHAYEEVWKRVIASR